MEYCVWVSRYRTWYLYAFPEPLGASYSVHPSRDKSQQLLQSAGKKQDKTASAVLTGVALGPIFSSCSPTFAWVIAVVIPENSIVGIFYLFLYCLGLALALLAIVLFGQKFLSGSSGRATPMVGFKNLSQYSLSSLDFLSQQATTKRHKPGLSNVIF